MAMKRIVVVGCGSIGQRHARLLAQREDIQLELCEPNEKCLADTLALTGDRTCYRNLTEALASRPGLVLIATPHSFHADQTIEALAAGAHVLCEKPMSSNLEDALRMADAAKDAATVLDFGFTLHFHPALLRLRQLIQSGELGNIVHMHCRVGTYATLEASRSHHQAVMEGALLLDYVHQPDLLYWMSGHVPTSVYMSATRAGDLPLQSNPNVADLILNFEDALRATIHINYVQAPQRHEYEITGDRAWARLDMETQQLVIGNRANNSATTETFTIDRDAVFQAEHQAFLDAAAGIRPPESPPETALVAMRILDAALRSWKADAPAPLNQL